MARYLIALSLGPVQSLIGAARRTRDLWCGSWLLSEAARAAAGVLHKAHPGCLIFPHLEDAGAELAPHGSAADSSNVSNILRAEIQVQDAGTVRTLCDAAKEAASGRLHELGQEARRSVPVRNDVWNAQIGDLLEYYGAWVPVGDEGYGAASSKLGVTLAARKATRDFRQCLPLASQGLPKSSLDGARETVLPDGLSAGERLRMGLSDGEQLDALGVMKRLAGKVDQFTPYSRIAADTWVQELTDSQQQRVRSAYDPLVAIGLATRVRGNAGAYEALPFDGQLLYSSRLDAESKANAGLAELGDLKHCLREIGREKGSNGEVVGEPVPYAAILKADGDRMGELLSRARTVDQSRTISRALHAFASQVRAIVREHRGHAIYAGGDDILALVPLTGAVECATELAKEFEGALAVAADELGADRPTLSVGLGIGHFMQPLGTLRERAERAENLAKGDGTTAPRNALAIILGVRSGGEHILRVRWDDVAALADLERAKAAFRDRSLPSRVAYDLRGIGVRLAWLRDDDGARAKRMREAEVRRLLNRARTGGDAGGAVGQTTIAGEARALIERRVKEAPLDTVADMLVIGRWLAARTAADLGER